MSERLERAAAWIYGGLWSVLVKWFRVPEKPPNLPVAPGEHLESFRPAPQFLAYLKLWFWILLTIIDLVIVLAWVAVAVAVPWLGVLTFMPMLVVAVVPDIIAYLAIHLRYDTTWYVLSSRSLRIRRGIWVIHETTITFENVQEVKVVQGPIERWFGIANVIVETAGSGAGRSGSHGQSYGGMASLGMIEGIADAKRVRDLVLSRLREAKTAGLGDEPESRSAAFHGTHAAWGQEHVAALRAIRDELAAWGR